MCQCTSEQWRTAPGYEGYYEVSTCGRVRSLDRTVPHRTSGTLRLRGRILRTATDKNGRQHVILSKFGKDETQLVHNLVLQAFVGHRPPEMEGCHGPNGINDNHPSNLYWGSHSRNMLDKQRDGTDHQHNKLTCPRRHPLAEPNLVPSKLPTRQCLACDRASSAIWYARVKKGLLLDLQTVADAHYAQIMGTPV